MQETASVAIIIATLGAVIRWLLQVWFKQSKEIENLRSSVIDGSIARLDSVVTDHKKSINVLDFDIKNLKTEITKLLSSNAKLGESWTEVSQKLDRYIEDNQKRFDTIETEVKQITKDLVLVKGKIIERNK